MVIAQAATAAVQISGHVSRMAMMTPAYYPFCCARSASLPHPFGISVWPPAGGLLLKRQSARILTACNYLVVKLKNVFKPRVPTRGTKVLDRPEWIHEIQHDGYRLII
jgi:hypothetical protein